MKKLLIILGPTSTGKTDIGINLARKLNGEIISADSRQVYKYLDIGTGKLPGSFKTLKKEEGAWEIDSVKVWMYDVASPYKRFNLYQYILRAEKLVREISELGKLPIIVGGTGLYIRSLIEGVSDFGLEENEKLREGLEKLDIEEIKNQINKLNPDLLGALNNSDLSNKRRLIRYLEKLSSASDQIRYAGLRDDFNILKIGLSAPREILRQRIKERVIKRVDQGMIKEAAELIKKGILTFARMDELGLEYRYLAKLLNKEIKTLDDFIKILSLKIGQYAKRQETWFKKEKNVIWFDITEKNFFEKVEKQVLDWYN